MRMHRKKKENIWEASDRPWRPVPASHHDVREQAKWHVYGISNDFNVVTACQIEWALVSLVQFDVLSGYLLMNFRMGVV